MSEIVVSVVIPTVGRTDLLERCLNALIAQTIGPDRYEVIVVDDSPSQETAAAVADAAERSQAMVRYLPNHTDSHGPAAARNLGWRAARGRVIAFTDDDTIPEPTWLANGVAAFSDGEAGAMGRIVVPLSRRPTDTERDTAGLETAEFATANAFYKKRALEMIGGFDERFRMAWREDADVHFALVEQGQRLVHADDAVVVHPPRPASWGASIAAQKKTEYNALLYKKHPTLYRSRLGHSPRWYYGALFTLLMAPIALLRGRRRQAALFGALWGAMTLGFAAKRLAGASKRPSHIAEMVVTSAVIPPLSVFERLRGAVKFRVFYW